MRDKQATIAGMLFYTSMYTAKGRGGLVHQRDVERCGRRVARAVHTPGQRVSGARWDVTQPQARCCRPARTAFAAHSEQRIEHLAKEAWIHGR